MPFLGFNVNTKAKIAERDAANRALLGEEGNLARDLIGNEGHYSALSPIGAYDANRLNRTLDKRINEGFSATTADEVQEDSRNLRMSKREDN